MIDHPDDWKKTWELIDRKYQQNPDYRRFSCSGPRSDFNIDAEINGAYICPNWPASKSSWNW